MSKSKSVEKGRDLILPGPKHHHTVLILGGGTAGITVAARLRRARRDLDIGLVEPSTTHAYQPLWTLVGGGIVDRSQTVRREVDFVPRGVRWHQDRVVSIDTEARRVGLADGGALSYDYLVVALGIQIDWDRIDGLGEVLGSGGVCTNYSFEHVPYTWEAISGFRGGNAVFTAPGTAIKCGGAPQKIMYLAESAFRRQGVRDRSEVIFASAGASIFGVEKYRVVFEEIVRRRGIQTHFHRDLVAVRAASREAVFRRTDAEGEEIIPYDLLHVVPPMSAPDVIEESDLGDAEGWVEVDKHSLRHVRHGEVFALGDNAGTPNGKTGAAVRKQAPVLVANLLAVMHGKEPTASYDGYTSCPVVTDYGKLVLAEFDYEGQPRETFPFNQAKERRSMYLLKRYLLPALYWHGMLRGRA